MEQTNHIKKESEDKINRREAIHKMGYTALTASVMMLLLNSPKARATSTSTPVAPPKTDGSGEIPWD